MPEHSIKVSQLLDQIHGCNDAQIDRNSCEVPVHKAIVCPLKKLRLDAKKDGIEIHIASGYRDFDRQLCIWNEKAAGVRPVFDDAQQLVDLSEYEPWEQVQAILRWSALPGASRHHWGTDIDVYDRSAIDETYSLQLSAEEYTEHGPFSRMTKWLDDRIGHGEAHGFFRPYINSNGGVAPEPWHLSYAPESVGYQKHLTNEGLAEFLTDKPIALKNVVLGHLPEIYDRYVIVNRNRYPELYRRFL
ncbi:MAG: LAS superfamily LD-carboxypeptidase LdcB [Oceanicoccus sp.]|jgi:LAS superfamily LD-carboxypeptidase LdcB